MPAYNFLARFADGVLSGRKTTTIRRRRKRPTAVGDQLHLYTGMRSKACRKLLSTPCVAVWPMEIHADRSMYRCGKRMSAEEIEDLALHDTDGQMNAREFLDFFETAYGLPVTDLELIEW